MQESSFHKQPGSLSNEADIDRILQLARQQGHWLERLILPGLSSLFIISLLILARQYLMVFVPRISVPPWIMIVGAVSAIESIYVAGFHVRLRTPMSLRIAEFALLLGLVYGGLRVGGAGQQSSFFSSVIWRDPEILVPILLVAGAWFLARGYGQTFVWLGDIAREVGDQGAATFSWETESYLSDFQISSGRAQAVSYFTRRFLFYVCLACIFNAIIVENFADRLVPLAYWNSLTSLATLGLLLSGMLLQACVYLYRLRVIWQEVKIPVGGELPCQWLWSSVAFVGLMLLVAVILPAGPPPLNFTRTMEVLAQWVGAGMEFSLPQRDRGVSSVYKSSPVAMGSPEAGAFSWVMAILYFGISIILALLVIGALVALVGLVLLAIFKDEWEKLHGLARIPIFVYLWLRETAHQLLKLLTVGAKRGKQLFSRLQRASTSQTTEGAEGMPSERASPSAPALYIRHLFTLVMEAAARYGLRPHTSQTPLEYSASLCRQLDGAEEELRLLTDYYIRARYSRHDFSPEVRPLIDTLWKAVVTAIDTWRDRTSSETTEEDGDKTD